MSDSRESSGAVRSADGDHYDFTSLPLIGLLAVARTSHEGAKKYGRYNYVRGFPAWKLVNRSLRHIVLWLLGDDSEPNLEHAAWGLLAAIQAKTLDSEGTARTRLGAGCTLGPELLGAMAEESPVLAEFRRTEEARALGEWRTEELPEVRAIMAQRGQANG